MLIDSLFIFHSILSTANTMDKLTAYPADVTEGDVKSALIRLDDLFNVYSQREAQPEPFIGIFDADNDYHFDAIVHHLGRYEIALRAFRDAFLEMEGDLYDFLSSYEMKAWPRTALLLLNDMTLDQKTDYLNCLHENYPDMYMFYCSLEPDNVIC